MERYQHDCVCRLEITFFRPRDQIKPLVVRLKQASCHKFTQGGVGCERERRSFVNWSLLPLAQMMSHLHASSNANTSGAELRSRKTVSNVDAVDLEERRHIHDTASVTPLEVLRL